MLSDIASVFVTIFLSAFFIIVMTWFLVMAYIVGSVSFKVLSTLLRWGNSFVIWVGMSE